MLRQFRLLREASGNSHAGGSVTILFLRSRPKAGRAATPPFGSCGSVIITLDRRSTGAVGEGQAQTPRRRPNVRGSPRMASLAMVGAHGNQIRRGPRHRHANRSVPLRGCPGLNRWPATALFLRCDSRYGLQGIERSFIPGARDRIPAEVRHVHFRTRRQASMPSTANPTTTG